MNDTSINDILLNKEDGGSPEVAQPQNTEQELPSVRYYCDSLGEDEINDMIEDVKPELITMLGLAEVGKTTFLGTLYHIMRCDGMIAGYDFVDSDTLAGYERKVFKRKASNSHKSVTQRTQRPESPFLNMYLRNQDTGQHRVIVFSDKAGEIYRSYISDTGELNKEKTLQLSDRILLFINSEDLLGREASRSIDEMRSFYKRLNSANLLPESAMLYVIYNKYDKITESNKDKFNKRKGEMDEVVRESFSHMQRKEFSVNSKDPDNSILTSLFDEIIRPLSACQCKELDWVRSETKEIKQL